MGTQGHCNAVLARAVPEGSAAASGRSCGASGSLRACRFAGAGVRRRSHEVRVRAREAEHVRAWHPPRAGGSLVSARKRTALVQL